MPSFFSKRTDSVLICGLGSANAAFDLSPALSYSALQLKPGLEVGRARRWDEMAITGKRIARTTHGSCCSLHKLT
jgi:hypothetical protein